MKNKRTIKEINGRYTCTKCGYEWSAMCGEAEIPDVCECSKSGLTKGAKIPKEKKREKNTRVIEAVYFGDKFYSKSGSMMSSIYQCVNGDLVRWDWGKVQISLSNGNTVKIRPANKSEMTWAYAMLGKFMTQQSDS